MVAFSLLQTSRIDGDMYYLKKRDSLGVSNPQSPGTLRSR